MDKKRILIVDDEKDFTQLVKMGLETTGRYEVMTETKGTNGLAATKRFKPDLILLDILMPDMEGSQVAFQIKNDKDVKDIPIIFLTAVAREEEVEKGKGFIGSYPFIAKPVSIERLINVIEKSIT